MKTIRFFSYAVIATLAMSIAFTSCKKDLKFSYRAAQDNSTAEAAFNRAYNNVDKEAKNLDSKTLKLVDSTTCPILTIETLPGAINGYPKKITLDYGTSYCQCTDGYNRKGKIISVITDVYIATGCKVTSTFENYHEMQGSIDCYVQGTQVITNTGKNALQHPVYSVEVTNANVTTSEGTIGWGSYHEFEFFNGYNSWMNPFDDQYYLTGSSQGTDINGESFEVDITQKLELAVNCRWVKSGKLKIVNPGYSDIEVNYGNGTCDGEAVATVEGKDYVFYMY